MLEADAALCALQRRVATSRYLNPTNEPELRAAFAARKPLRPNYLPASWADEHLRALDRIRAPADHPLGAVLRRAVVETRLWTLALRDRTPAAFDAWGDAEGLRGAVDAPEPPAFPVRAVDSGRVGAAELARHLGEALGRRGYRRWRVELDPVMTARVLVDAPSTVVRVNTRATCTPTELRALEAHEIDVHVARAEAGARQPLKLFAHGLPGCLATEEGLALHAEAEVAGLPEGVGTRLRLVALAAERARDLGFTDLVRELAPAAGTSAAFGMALRVKRGLAQPEAPGAYGKDRAYWLGLCRVSAYLRGGGRRERLMVGKVGLDTPVDDWVREGWISLPG